MRVSRLSLFLCALALVGAAVPAFAGWESLGAMPAPARDGATLLFRNRQGTVAVTAVDPHVVRVRFQPGSGGLGRDHSYALVAAPGRDAAAQAEVGADRSVLRTAALRVTLTHAPFRVAIAAADGSSLDEDDALRGMSFAGRQTRTYKRLREDEHVYGFGEKTGEFDKRGRYRGGYVYAMWNSDTYAYGEDTDPIYASVPFFMVLRQGRAHGVFFDNTFRTIFDVGREAEDRLSFGSEDGEMDYYFIDGPTPADVVRRYTTLTGRTPLPPLWSLGYHQCRYSYYPESRVRFIAQNFRERRIPADVLWLDIHYLQGYNPFTWDRERFPDPARMIRDLRAQGFRVVTIVDPHPKKQPGWPVYESGLAGDHFVKNPDGSVYEGNVWPSQAEKDPGPSVFPDFTKPEARRWWGTLFKEPYTDLGVAGIWNDMNEPAVFREPTHTMPLDVRHDNEGQPTDHREVHNVYGLAMTRGTFEGLARLRPDERPFVLTRATYAGGQRWAAVWPGDNVSDWNHLRATIPMFLNMGLSGFSFVGSDIGGFAEFPTPELYTRWLQLGVFYPFMRTHSTFGTPDQEPWSYGLRWEEINRRAIEMRYELLPTVYNVMEEASRTGLPAFRPLLLEYPDDAATYGLGDQFLLGRDVLVAPALRELATERELYLPKGAWYDYATGERLEGGRKIKVPLALDHIPVFLRAGSVLFRQPVLQHTGERAGQPLRVLVHGEDAEGTLYEDDGESLAHTRGAWMRRRVSVRAAADGWRVEVAAPEGSYRPAARDLVVEWRGPAPRSVTVGGRTIEPLASPGGKGLVRIRVPDRWEAFSIALLR
jgi:alpha-glucosidase